MGKKVTPKEIDMRKILDLCPPSFAKLGEMLKRQSLPVCFSATHLLSNFL